MPVSFLHGLELARFEVELRPDIAVAPAVVSRNKLDLRKDRESAPAGMLDEPYSDARCVDLAQSCPSIVKQRLEFELPAADR